MRKIKNSRYYNNLYFYIFYTLLFQVNTPFRRVKDEDIDEDYLKKFGKNAFDSKVCWLSDFYCFLLYFLYLQRGAKGSWGEKANDVLKTTKGKSFRHEKTKKKRGSYRGGKIDTSTYSIQFSDSENQFK